MKKIIGFIVAVLAMASNAMAASPWVDVSSISIDTSPVATLLLTILGAIAAIWVSRKLIKLGNKS